MEKNQDVKERLAAYLKELHLPAFRSSYEELARQAQQEGLSLSSTCWGQAQRECQERRNKPRRASAERLEAAVGEELVGAGPEEAAAQGGAAGADAAGGIVPGSL